MVGDSLMVAHHTDYFTDSRSIYLPAGLWYDYRTHVKTHSTGRYFTRPVYYTITNQTIFAVPLFVKSGSIIPRVYVDDGTINNYGKRQDGSIASTQTVRVWINKTITRTFFDIIEDDGDTIGYISGQKTTTHTVFESGDNSKWNLTFEASVGKYEGALTERNYAVEFIFGKEIDLTHLSVGLFVDGKKAVLEYAETADYMKSKNSYSFIEDRNGVVVFSSVVGVECVKRFILEL